MVDKKESVHLSPVKKRVKESSPPQQQQQQQNEQYRRRNSPVQHWQHQQQHSQQHYNNGRNHRQPTITIEDTPSPAVSVITISDSDDEGTNSQKTSVRSKAAGQHQQQHHQQQHRVRPVINIIICLITHQHIFLFIFSCFVYVPRLSAASRCQIVMKNIVVQPKATTLGNSTTTTRMPTVTWCVRSSQSRHLCRRLTTATTEPAFRRRNDCSPKPRLKVAAVWPTSRNRSTKWQAMGATWTHMGVQIGRQ